MSTQGSGGRIQPGWPRLALDDWTATRDTLHMWTQIVGKIRLAQAPMVNHWWQVTLYVTPRGLTTSAIPVRRPACSRSSSTSSTTGCASAPATAAPRAVALRAASRWPTSTPRHGGAATSWGSTRRSRPGPTRSNPRSRSTRTTEHASYDPRAAHLFWRQLVQAHRVIARVPVRTSSARSARCTSSGARGPGLHPLLRPDRAARTPAARRTAPTG